MQRTKVSGGSDELKKGFQNYRWLSQAYRKSVRQWIISLPVHPWKIQLYLLGGERTENRVLTFWDLTRMHWLQFSVFSEPFQSGWKSNSTALTMVWTRAGGSAQLFISAKLSALSFRTHSRRSCSMNRWNRISPCLNFATCSASGIKSKPFKKFLRSICYSRLTDQKALPSFWLTLCLLDWLVCIQPMKLLKMGMCLRRRQNLPQGQVTFKFFWS